MVIELPPKVEALIREQVDNGRFASADEVIAAAVRLLEERDRKRRWLLAALAEGEEGEGIPYTPRSMRQIQEEADAMPDRNVSFESDRDAWP